MVASWLSSRSFHRSGLDEDGAFGTSRQDSGYPSLHGWSKGKVQGGVAYMPCNAWGDATDVVRDAGGADVERGRGGRERVRQSYGASAARPESLQIFSAHRRRQRSPKLSSAPTLHPLIFCAADMKISNHSEVPVYTISGSNTARPLPEWLARKRKRSLKQDPEYASRIELLQDFEFEEASSCVRVSEDGNWIMSTGMP